MTKLPVMVTLLPSSDVDLGRWLMQRWERPFSERPHAPIFHILALKWWGMGKTDSPLLIEGATKTPTVDKLIARFDHQAPPERRVLPDAETEPALYGEVMQLHRDARLVMGVGTVHWAYYHFLQHKKVVWPSLTTGVPWWEKAFLTVGYGVIKSKMDKGLGLGPQDAEKALDTVRRAWDETDERLADGRRFLAGDRLTLADLAFSTSGAPMVLADGYGGHLPRLEDCPNTMQPVISDLRARPSGMFIQRIYDNFRDR